MVLATRVAQRLGFDEAALAEISLAARLHDVGKIGVPDAILLKEGPLDEPTSGRSSSAARAGERR